MYERSLELPGSGSKSFFLWGPRQAGKSTLLKKTYPDAIWVDLLKSDELRSYTTRPERLRLETAEGMAARGVQVVIDEIQNVPALLNEVHWLIENRGLCFALCASSARKLRRKGVNLLGGRALRYELSGLTANELGTDFDLKRILNRGYLPPHYDAADLGEAERQITAYVSDYLRQEILNEGQTRNLASFSDFLDAAALRDGSVVNFSNIARETGVSSVTVKNYFEILTDTLIGRWLPAYRKRPKGREVLSRKFYFSDVGVVNHLARRGEVLPGSEAFGKAFENWVFHELSAYVAYRSPGAKVCHWRLPGGQEVDFLIDGRVAIEAKAREVITKDHLKGLRALRREHPEVERTAVVCTEPKPLRTDDGIDVLPAPAFVERLWGGELI